MHSECWAESQLGGVSLTRWAGLVEMPALCGAVLDVVALGVEAAPCGSGRFALAAFRTATAVCEGAHRRMGHQMSCVLPQMSDNDTHRIAALFHLSSAEVRYISVHTDDLLKYISVLTDDLFDAGFEFRTSQWALQWAVWCEVNDVHTRHAWWQSI